MWKPCTLRTCPASKSSGSRGLVTIKTTLLLHASAGVQSLEEICFTEARSATLLELYWTGVVASHTPQVDPSIEDYIYLGNPGDESPVEIFVLCEIKCGGNHKSMPSVVFGEKYLKTGGDTCAEILVSTTRDREERWVSE